MNNLSKYIETLDLIEEHVAKLRIKTNKISIKTAGTLLAVTLDHAQGIKFCLKNSAYSSAFALLRIIFETYIRAMWLEKCATPKQLDKYINNDKIISKGGGKLNFDAMVSEVESSHQLPKYFSKVQKNTWKGLNSLTHSGSIQLKNNFNGKSITNCYDNKHINEAIDFATMISCMAFAGLCDLATNINSSKELEQLIEFIQSWAFQK